MKYTADAYFDEYNMQDIQLISTVGFTDEDVDAIRQIEGVKGVHATYSMDALTTKGSKQITLKVLAMPSLDPDRDDPNYINQVRLVDGRMPENSGECLVENSHLIESDLEIGDTITLTQRYTRSYQRFIESGYVYDRGNDVYTDLSFL